MYLCIYLPLHLSTSASIDLGIKIPLYLSTSISIYLCTMYLYTSLPLHLYTYIPLHLCTSSPCLHTNPSLQGECSLPQCPALTPPSGGQVNSLSPVSQFTPLQVTSLSPVSPLPQFQVAPSSCSDGSSPPGTRCSYSCDQGYLQSGASVARSIPVHCPVSKRLCHR